MSMIADISEAFRDYLQDSVSVVNGGSVWLGDPTEGNNAGVSLWLYQVSLDEFIRNGAGPIVDPSAPSAGGGAPRRRSLKPPLGVNLSFLITPMNHPVASKTALNVVNQVLLTIHEAPLLPIRDSNLGLNEQVRIHVVSDNFEERHRLWDSLKDKPYRLSFTCVLRTARLFSTKLIDEAAVLTTTGAALSGSQAS